MISGSRLDGHGSDWPYPNMFGATRGYLRIILVIVMEMMTNEIGI